MATMGRTRIKWRTAGATLVLLTLLPLQAWAAGAGRDDGTEKVPLRTVVESIGAVVKWNADNRQAVVTRGQVELVVTIGTDTALVNRQARTMDSKAGLSGGQTLVSLDTIRQAFDVDVNWDPQAGLLVGPEDVKTRGSYFIHLLQSDRFKDARAMMNQRLQQQLPEQLLQTYWVSNTTVYGSPAQLLMLNQEETVVHNNAMLGYATPQQTPFSIIIRFDDTGKIDDLYLPYLPSGAYQKPSYDNPAQYVERQVVVGEGEHSLPGTLTLPKGKGPFTAVVLVHGSGPSDRDESTGAYKPFRDLAAGLAAQRIAVLRFEKRTYERTLQSALNPQFTIKDESVDDALAAVKVLQQQPEVNAAQIFVLGHSQGGMLVPRIVQQDSADAIAGAIVMAGPSEPLEDLLLTQYQQAAERAKQAGQPTDTLDRQIQIWEQQMVMLKDPQYSVTHIPKNFAVQNPVWWFDFRNYYAGELAKDQDTPMLIMQGENDFQVGPGQLEGWKKALAARTDVSYKLYPKLNHFFVSVDQPSTGAEYALPGNISDQVISDIADWLNGVSAAKPQ